MFGFHAGAHATHPQLDPLVHVALLVELDEEASARDDERAALRLAPAATHATERVVLVVAEQPCATLQRHRLVDLQNNSYSSKNIKIRLLGIVLNLLSIWWTRDSKT